MNAHACNNNHSHWCAWPCIRGGVHAPPMTAACHPQTTETSKLLHFFSARWLDLAISEVWAGHEWVLHLDGDTIFLDLSRGFEELMASGQHLFWQIRLNKEVTAAAALMRTSPFSECFLRLWGAKGVFWRPNYDNGDLLSTLLDFAAPQLAQACDPLRQDGSYGEYIDCFARAHTRLLRLHAYMPITTFAPLAGFWKSLEGLHDPAFQQKAPLSFKLLLRCWSTDFIGHGSKTIGTWAWWLRKDQNLLEPDCLFNTPEDELAVARECCLWHYPGVPSHHPRAKVACRMGVAACISQEVKVVHHLRMHLCMQAALSMDRMSAALRRTARTPVVPSCAAAGGGGHRSAFVSIFHIAGQQ